MPWLPIISFQSIAFKQAFPVFSFPSQRYIPFPRIPSVVAAARKGFMLHRGVSLARSREQGAGSRERRA